MKVALCFWGLTRSLKYTIHSIQKNILDILKKSKIDYDIYLHTYKFQNTYSNHRSGELNIILQNDEYKLLQPDHVSIDDNDTIRKFLNFKQYHSKKDPWNTNYQSVNNFILSLFSKKQLWNLIKTNGKLHDYDSFIFLRPDVRYLCPINIQWLHSIHTNSIMIPSFHNFHFGFNDRFAICKYSIAEVYSLIFNVALTYSKKFPLHSETMIKYILLKFNPNLQIKRITFPFNRVRANGRELPDNKL
jgi:hypothetical protein